MFTYVLAKKKKKGHEKSNKNIVGRKRGEQSYQN